MAPAAACVEVLMESTTWCTWTARTEAPSCSHQRRRGFILELTRMQDGIPVTTCHEVPIFSLDPPQSRNGVRSQANPEDFATQSSSGIPQVKKGSAGGRTTVPPKKAGRKTTLRKVNGSGGDILVAFAKGKKIFLSRL